MQVFSHFEQILISLNSYHLYSDGWWATNLRKCQADITLFHNGIWMPNKNCHKWKQKLLCEKWKKRKMEKENIKGDFIELLFNAFFLLWYIFSIVLTFQLGGERLCSGKKLVFAMTVKTSIILKKYVIKLDFLWETFLLSNFRLKSISTV